MCSTSAKRAPQVSASGTFPASVRGCVFDGRKGERGEKTVLITTRNEKPAFPPLERKMTIKRKRGHCQVKSRNLCLLFFSLMLGGEINFDMTHTLIFFFF